ncbi:S9 family peptidase, partial [Acidobacteriota bacterium]
AFQAEKPYILKPVEAISSWLDDEYYLSLERDEITGKGILFKVKAQTGEKTSLFDHKHVQKFFPKGLDPSQYDCATADYRGLIYLFQGDIYYFSVDKEKLKRLTSTSGLERNPCPSPDGRYVAYTRDFNLYATDIEAGQEYQLSSDGSDTIYNGWASWVYYEEILGRNSNHAAFWWSPDSSRIAFLRFDDSPAPVFPLFESGGAHGRLESERYPKSGDPNPRVKLGVATLKDGSVVWADLKKNADYYVAWPFCQADSSKLTFQWMNRSQNNIKIYTMDLRSGEKKELYDEKQSSWVEFFKDLYFFQDGSGFLLRSDVDGWYHLYYYDLSGGLKKRLTKGEWTVVKISLVDEKNKQVFFEARKDQTTETHFFQVGLDSTSFKRITEISGTHAALFSPGGSYFIDNFSSINTPNKEELYRADGTLIRNISQSRTPLIEESDLGKKELFSIPTEDGKSLPAWWILPPDFDAGKQYPVVFSIYGGPRRIRVSNSYSPLSFFYLAQEGIIVICVDHRGSGHFGKKGASLMFRNLGLWETHDLIEAVKWLRKKPFIDQEKIGITGGSYGGYTTCMALTHGADYFTHGYARSPVTDWRLYDTVYTERYMDSPLDNKKGYEFGSLMTHAKKQKGYLYLSHGDIDDNVHMQNTIQLIDKLMNLGKKFEFMLYPNQRHGFKGKKKEYSDRQYVNFWLKHFFPK